MTPSPAPWRAPRALTVAITGRCNLRCRHCLVESGPEAREDHVPAEVVMRVARELAALGGDELWLTGGEPLAHPRWAELLAACRSLPLRTVGLQTNGTLLGEAEVATLRALRLDGLRLQISVDGASPRTHDRVRGAGSFARTLDGLRRLSAAGLGPRVVVAFTEMRHNLEELGPLLERVAALGLGRLRSATLVAGGRAGGGHVAPPEPGQVTALLARFHGDARFRRLVERHADVAAVEWWRNRRAPGPPCCAAGEHPYLGADGSVAPCALIRAGPFALSGWLDEPLGAVLARAAAGWARLEALRRARPARLAACRGCLGERHCAGGCMGRAFAAGGDLCAVEDRCALRRAVYAWPGPIPSTTASESRGERPC